MFKDFSVWYNNKDVVPNPEFTHKSREFYHKKGKDILKWGSKYLQSQIEKSEIVHLLLRRQGFV